MKVIRPTVVILAVLLLGLVSYAGYRASSNNATNRSGDGCGDVSVPRVAERVKEIEAGRATYTSSTRSIFGQSSQGGHQDDYRLKDEILLKQQVFFGEMGRSEASYYLSKGKVFYFIKKNIEYINSIYDDHSGAIRRTEVKEFYLGDNQGLCSWYLNGALQANDQDTRDLVEYLISGLE